MDMLLFQLQQQRNSITQTVGPRSASANRTLCILIFFRLAREGPHQNGCGSLCLHAAASSAVEISTWRQTSVFVFHLYFSWLDVGLKLCIPPLPVLELANLKAANKLKDPSHPGQHQSKPQQTKLLVQQQDASTLMPQRTQHHHFNTDPDCVWTWTWLQWLNAKIVRTYPLNVFIQCFLKHHAP